MKYLTAGNSHGKYLIGILTGLPYGIKISESYLKKQLEGRRKVEGRGIRQKIEKDEFEIISGLKNSITTANPVGVILYNNSVKKVDYSYFTPGYGDLYGAIKYFHSNTSIIKERASARETAIRVLLFSFTKKMLEDLNIKISYEVIQCYNSKDKKNFKDIINNFKKEGDSFGGMFRITVKNLPVGLGDYTEGIKRLQSRLSEMLFSIGAIKGVSFGKGFEIVNYRASEIIKNNKLLGGIQAGITDGNDLIINCAVRAIASVPLNKKSFDLKRNKNTKISIKTSDITAVFAAAYISQYLVSYVIAEEIMYKFGSDNFDDIKNNLNIWRKKTEKILKNIKI